MKNVIIKALFLSCILPTAVFAEVGYRDLIIGKDVDISKYCAPKTSDTYECYGADDLEFSISKTTSTTEFKTVPKEEYQKLITYYDAYEKVDTIVAKTVFKHLLFYGDNCNGLIDADFTDKDTVSDWDLEIGSDWHYLGVNTEWEDVIIRTDEDAPYWCNQLFEIILKNGPFRYNHYDGSYQLKKRVINPSKIKSITVDVGPLYQTFVDAIIESESNPFIKLRNNLSNRYGMDWEFTERDKNLFNENEKNHLWSSFANSQIFLEIRRVNFGMELFVHYHTKEMGAKLGEERKPKDSLSGF